MKSILLSAALIIACLAGAPSGNAALAQEKDSASRTDVETLVEAHRANSRIQTERPDFEPEEDEVREPRDLTQTSRMIPGYVPKLCRLISGED